MASPSAVTRNTFFDTNVLLYADDESEPVKKERATALLAEHLNNRTAVFSVQVLQEYFNGAVRKLHVPADVAQKKVEIFARAHVVRFDPSDVIAAIELFRLNKISFWDALIVHAARMAGVSAIFSEDLQSGGTIAGIKICNPFSGT
jgi:predicted nucleic acid-binding protein